MKAIEPSCPACGAPVHLNSLSCGRCGARREAGGWGESGSRDGLDLPEDDDFDYDEFVAREFGESPENRFLHRMTTRQRFWWLVGVLTLIAFAILAIRGVF